MKRQAQEEMWQHRRTWHRDPWDPLDLHQLRICTASASPGTLPELSACGLWRTWTPKGQWRAPLTFNWCQLLGNGYTGGEKAERHNYHLVNCVGYWISPWLSLLISVLFNHPGTQGFPRDSLFPSHWKGKWPLQAVQEHHTTSNPSPEWVAWSLIINFKWGTLRHTSCNFFMNMKEAPEVSQFYGHSQESGEGSAIPSSPMFSAWSRHIAFISSRILTFVRITPLLSIKT